MSEAIPLVTRWHIVRHAPVRNPEGRIYGASDKPADCSDPAPFKLLAARLPRPAVWITTHLSRTRDTASAIFDAGYPSADTFVEPRLAEQDFGDWTGKTYAEVGAWQRERFWLAPAHERPPNGESFVDVIARVRVALTEHSNRIGDADVVCVAHGGTVRAMLALALDLDPASALRFSTDNLSTTMIDVIHATDTAPAAFRVRGVNRPAT
jgi:alpha-ribazole phosphatase